MTSAPSIRLLHADFVLPGEGDALADGAVAVDPRGMILEVGPASSLLPRHAGAPVERVRGALGPGLVNAHTHLELSPLRGRIPGGQGFVAWVERLVEIRADDEPFGDPAVLEQSLDEVDAAGTAAVGDVTNRLGTLESLKARGMAGQLFYEMFGMDRAKALAGAMALARDVAALPASEEVRVSPAPHTLYTTHPDAVRALVAAARARGTRSSVHLAEHPAERRLLETGGGPFAEFAARKRFDSPSFPIFGKGPVDVAEELGLLAPDMLLVHLTDARPEEIAKVARSGAHVVLCPRSNLHIEQRIPPFLDLLEAGVLPALGTDSLASNASLDVLAEAQVLAHRFPSVPGRVLFEMATAAGARALDRPDLGRIAPGARPGLVAFEGAVSGDPFLFALHRPPAERRWAVRRGAKP